MAVVDNLNPKINPLTTYLGLVMVSLSLIMFTAPLFVDLKKDIYQMWYIPSIIGCFGLLLLLSPDTLVGLISKIFSKKLEK